MPQANDVMDLFKGTGAYLKGHFRLTSGLHSPEYLQSALVLQHPRYAERLGAELAREIQRQLGDESVGLVVSPALGGLIIGHEVARALGTPHIFTERDPAGKMTLRRGFEVTHGPNQAAAQGIRAVVVEDVVTTGGSTREVIELLRSLGAQPVAAACIIDRSGGKADLSALPKAALVTLEVTAYQPENCPLCAQGLPVVKPGSRAA
jgi:orotate phosphoribosyltransferase